MKKNYFFIAILIPFLMAKTINVNAQLFGTTFKCYTINPPGIYLNGVKKIAVLNFSDETAHAKYYVTDGGTKIADYLVQTLMLQTRGLQNSDKLYLTGMMTNIFTIVERSQLDAVIKEQNLGGNGMIGDADAAKVGKLLGIDAIVSGSISYSNNDAYDKSSSTDKSGKVTTTYKVTRVVQTEARIKVINVQTGEVMANTNISSAASDENNSTNGSNSSALRPVDELKNQTYRDLANKMANYLTPSLHGTALDIKKIKTKEYKDKGKEAAGYIKDNQIDKALLIYKELFTQDSYNQEVAFNLGALNEGTGHFEEALKNYKVALQLDASEKDYKNAVARVENDIRVVKFLSDYGIQVTPYEFAEAGSSKLAAKAVTKGKKKDRYEVKEQANASSNVVAKVPGDTEFEIIKQDKDWILIKLLGEQQGYISSKDVDIKK